MTKTDAVLFLLLVAICLASARIVFIVPVQIACAKFADAIRDWREARRRVRS